MRYFMTIILKPEQEGMSVPPELGEAMGLAGEPLEQFVQRWQQGMPQYLVGHQARLDAMAAALTELPHLYLTGSSYRGVGLASCIADAERTAAAIVSARMAAQDSARVRA